MARFVTLMAITAMACGGDGDDGDGSTDDTPASDFKGSCYYSDYGDGQACIDYFGDLQFDVETSCTDQEGVYDADLCPTAGAVAFCSSTVAGATGDFTYYGGHDVDMLESACALGGGEFSRP